MGNGFIGTTWWEPTDLICGSNYINKEMENKGLTPEAQLSEKIFKDIVEGISTYLYEKISLERGKISKAFKLEFEAREDVKQLQLLREEHLKLQVKHANLRWHQSEGAVIEQIKAIEEKAQILTGIELPVYLDTYPTNYYEALYAREDNKVAYPEFYSRSVITAKLRLVKNLTDKTFDTLLKIAE